MTQEKVEIKQGKKNNKKKYIGMASITLALLVTGTASYML